MVVECRTITVTVHTVQCLEVTQKFANEIALKHGPKFGEAWKSMRNGGTVA